MSCLTTWVLRHKRTVVVFWLPVAGAGAAKASATMHRTRPLPRRAPLLTANQDGRLVRKWRTLDKSCGRREPADGELVAGAHGQLVTGLTECSDQFACQTTGLSNAATSWPVAMSGLKAIVETGQALGNPAIESDLPDVPGSIAVTGGGL